MHAQISGPNCDTPSADGALLGNALERLEVWQEARRIRNEVFALVQRFPRKERLGLGERMVRRSRQASGYIAKGLGAGLASRECLACLRKSRSSFFEILDCLDTARCCGFLCDADCQAITQRIKQGVRILSRYIQFLGNRLKE